MGWDGPQTHRQYVTWAYWDSEQWNHPSRTDNYLMQVACEVRRVLSKKPKSIQMKHFKMEFKTATSKRIEKIKSKQLTAQQAANISKAKWVSAVGMPVRVVKRGEPVPSMEEFRASMKGNKHGRSNGRTGKTAD